MAKKFIVIALANETPDEDHESILDEIGGQIYNASTYLHYDRNRRAPMWIVESDVTFGQLDESTSVVAEWNIERWLNS